MQDYFEENKSKYKQEIGSIIKKYRQKANKSISLISAEIGMTKSMWADLEKGIKDPQLSTLLRMSQGLNIPASQIVKDLETNLGQDFTLIEL